MIPDSDADLSSFLENCTPNNLKFLSINSNETAVTPIKSKINIKSLSKAVAAVTKEVYIRMYEFSEADLQQFVRAACNVERIIMNTQLKYYVPNFRIFLINKIWRSNFYGKVIFICLIHFVKTF